MKNYIEKIQKAPSVIVSSHNAQTSEVVLALVCAALVFSKMYNSHFSHSRQLKPVTVVLLNVRSGLHIFYTSMADFTSFLTQIFLKIPQKLISSFQCFGYLTVQFKGHGTISLILWQLPLEFSPFSTFQLPVKNSYALLVAMNFLRLHLIFQ